MSERDALEAIRACFREAMEVDDATAARISMATGVADISQWDSPRHMALVAALERRFAMELSDDQIVEMVSVAEILRIVTCR